MAFKMSTVVPRLQGAIERGQVIVEGRGAQHLKVGKIALKMVEMPKTGVLYDSGLGSDDARRPVWYYCIDRSESGVDPRGQIFPRLDPRAPEGFGFVVTKRGSCRRLRERSASRFPVRKPYRG